MIIHKLSGLLCDATSSLENVFDMVKCYEVCEDKGPGRDMIRVYSCDSATTSYDCKLQRREAGVSVRSEEAGEERSLG